MVAIVNNHSQQILEQPFGMVENGKLNKRGFSSRLFGASKELGMVVYIIRKSPSLLELFRFRHILSRKCRGIAIYAIANENDVDSGIQLMLSCRLWHPTVLHVILADAKYGTRLSQYCESSMEIIEFELANKDASFCTIEFVDDDALFYGGENAKKIINKFYPEIEQM